MLLSRRLPLSSLIELCRSLRHYLGAGLTLHDVFEKQARIGSLAVRPVAGRIAAQLERGSDLESALEPERASFPPLFVALAGVGEQSGQLPEVFAELEKYFRLQQKLWRQFASQIMWPLFQFFAAIFVIAGLLWILGLIAESNRTEAMDLFGVGTGAKGAVTFLALVFGLMAAAAALYLLATRLLRQKAAVYELLLRLPAIGPTLRALALARFCMALRLTTETGMPLARAVRLSLQATGNGAFTARSPVMERTVKGGGELAQALARAGLFGEEFVSAMVIAEETGQIAEVMQRQAEYYQEEATRRLKVLTQVAAWGVYLFVAILIIIAIFRIYSTAILPHYQT